MHLYRGLVAINSLFVFDNNHDCLSCRRKIKQRTALSEVSEQIDTPLTDNASKINNKYEAMLDWLKSQNEAFVNEKIVLKPSSLECGGYGAFVTDSVEENELLFRVPREACITLSDAFNDLEFGESFRKLVETAGPGGNTVVLAGFIAKERVKSIARGNMNSIDSKFSPYLATLPWERGVNNQEHILYWTDDEVETLLTGTMCYGEAIDLRKEVTFAIKVLENILSKPTRAFRLPWDSENPQNLSLENLPEAVTAAIVCLLTRAFQDDTTGDNTSDEEKLVPLLDMLQHSEEPNVSHAMLRESNGNVEVRSRRALDAGEELLNQYRSELEESMPYHRFFTRFGFVPGIEEPILDLLRDKSSIFVAQKAEV